MRLAGSRAPLRLLGGFIVSFALASVLAAATSVYKGVLVMDAASGDIVFEDSADYSGPPASVTKLMSFLVVKDAIRAGRLTLQTDVTVSADDSRIGGTQVWLKEGEVFTVEELLMAMMIQSANDAAHALARATSGSREAFVAAMNARAQQLGMTHTTWRTPHGLPPSSRQLAESDITSPRDLALLSRALLRETDILRYTSIPLAHFGEGKRAQPVMMDNHNNLVGKVRGVDGLKTGFTRAAGFCLAATAERDGRRVIAVIMGSPSAKERDIKMAELLETAFAKLGPAPAGSGAVISPAPERAPTISRVPLDPQDGPPPPAKDPAADPNQPPPIRFKLPK